MISFTLTDEQIEKVSNWHKSHKRKGLTSYTFTPTGIGIAIECKCPCGKILDLSEVEKW